MLNLRAVVSESDVEECKKLLPEGVTEPNWQNCLLVERDGEVVAVGGAQMVARIEPLFVKHPRDAVAWMALVCELEGWLRSRGVRGFEFFIQDRFPKYQEFVEKHFAVTEGRQAPGKTYFRVLE